MMMFLSPHKQPEEQAHHWLSSSWVASAKTTFSIGGGPSWPPQHRASPVHYQNRVLFPAVTWGHGDAAHWGTQAI